MTIKHNERCKECKRRIFELLTKIYGEVKERFNLNLPCELEKYQEYEFYDALKTIYIKLQNHRGFKRFVRAKKLPNVDYFVVNPGFIIEFDESQHFTKPREITLKNYPEKLKLGFDKNMWIKRCIDLNRKDNDPPYRDEQRAWYDTLRDFSSLILNIPIIRLLPEECVWCELNPEKETDVRWFKELIRKKLKLHLGEEIKTTKKMKIGLAFPELGKHNIKHFLDLMESQRNKLDLIVFPEGFETICPENEIRPEEIGNEKEVKNLINKYFEICNKFNVSIILGVQVDYHNTSISGGGNDQYCLFIDPTGKKYIYHKHSTSRFNAFFDNDWSIKTNFPVVQVNNTKVGISICHDSYISLIAKVLKKKGADIWVNVSYQNVRPHIWEAVLQTRVAENKMIAICTLHRNSKPKKGEGRPQKEPYVFSETGKIKLKDLESDLDIQHIPVEKRTGKIFYFDSSDYETYPIERLEESKLAKKAEKITIGLDDEENLRIEGGKRNYSIKEISIEEFIFSPEKLWKLSLERKNEVTLFVVIVRGNEEWKKYQSEITRIIKGRVIEFSTLFLFIDKKQNNIFMAAYRSSNYKDSRIFYPKGFPLKFDERYLKGLESTYEISLDDFRKKSESIYFKRVNQVISFLQKQ